MRITATTRINPVYRTILDKILNFIHGRIRYTDRAIAVRYIKDNFPNHQYTGEAPFDELVLWCESNFKDNWLWDFETFYFKYEEDLVFFKLKWA